MPINLKLQTYIDLRQRIREDPRSFVVITGAGISKQNGIPLWTELKEHFVEFLLQQLEHCNAADLPLKTLKIKQIRDELNLWRAFELIKQETDGAYYVSTIRSMLSPTNREKNIYKDIWALDIKGLINFNLDKSAMDAFAASKQRSVDTAHQKEIHKYMNFLSSGDNFIFHPHGILSDESTWVFTDSERTETYRVTHFKDFLTQTLSTKNILILGFNATDNSFRFILEHLSMPRLPGYDNYLILNTPSDSDISYFSRMGIKTISYEADATHSEIDTILRDLKKFTPRDSLAPVAYLGSNPSCRNIPNQQELGKYEINDLREILNENVARIVPADHPPTEENLRALNIFYKENVFPINLAWTVEPDSAASTFFNYHIKREIGRGVFGQVCSAQDDRNVDFAIKVLHSEVRTKNAYLNSFRRGIQSLRILNRQNTPRVVKLINAYEVPASLVMEFVPGSTMTQAISSGLLANIQDIIKLLIQVAETIVFGHKLPEKVLHRDLKPDNIILRDYYSNDDEINICILDYDLSWYQGALELPIQDVRDRGYAAPEQLTSDTDQTTRHTGVDSFGLGMLIFYAFLKEDPAPNEHRFANFRERVLDRLTKTVRSKWKFIPYKILNLIVNATKEQQSERIPVSEILVQLRDIHNTLRTDEIKDNHLIILEEIAGLLTLEKPYETEDFGRKIRIPSADNSSYTTIFIKTQRNRPCFGIEIKRVRADADSRSFMKYVDSIREKALSKLPKNLFSERSGEIQTGGLCIMATIFLESKITYQTISDIADCIKGARMALEFQ